MRSIVFFFSLLALSLSISAQELVPVKWSMNVEKTADNEYNLSWRADIDKGWNVYSQFTSDDGPVPTEIVFESEGFETIGDAKETGKKKEGYDKLFDTDVIKFLADQPFIINQKVKINSDVKEIKGYLTYMTCDDEKCLPPTDVDFSFPVAFVSGSGTAPQQETKEPVQKTLKTNGGVAITKTIEPVKKAVKEEATTFTMKKSVEDVSGDDTAVESETMTFDLSDDSYGLDEDSPVNWTFELVPGNDGSYKLKYKADILKNWNVYSQYTSDDGPVPTEIIYEENEGVEFIGKATEEGYKKEGPDPLFDGAQVIKFTDKEPFIITQEVKAGEDGKLKGYLTYMTCDDSHCKPPTDVEFQIDFKNGYFGPPKKESISTATGMNIGPDNLLDQSIQTIKASYANPVKDCGGEDNSDQGILWSFVLGFMGGLLALLTPCVFPMIPLTVSFFTKDTKRSGLTNGLIYGASIIVIYVTLGLVLTALFGEEALNALSTNWIANTIFFFIFIFFAFSFFGYYEITLPSSWTTKTDSMADKGGLIGIFFMAFTLALVSFSCTGPIIGSAIVSAASSSIGPAVVMFGFSLALALPFGLFAAFPAWLNSLPRSGGWMNSVKVVLGFLELAFAFKFLSVADMTSHWGFLKYELFLAIWVLVAIGMALYVFGILRFPHDSPVKKLSASRWVLGLSCVALSLYLASGFIVDKNNPSSYIPKGLTSGIAPPANYNFFLKKASVDESIKAEFPSYTKCANDIPCFKDYYEGLNYAKKINKPVFLDFTGHGCVNCRKTEEFIWVKPEVKEKLESDFVLVSLYVDDREKLPEQFVSKRLDPQGNNVKIRNVGNKWADFQIVNFQQNSQPLYVMMTNEEKVVSNPRGYREGSEAYLDYLECGLNTIQEME